jgi:hypothetical protein
MSIESRLERLARDKYYRIFGLFIALKTFITLPTSLLKIILKSEKQFFMDEYRIFTSPSYHLDLFELLANIRIGFARAKCYGISGIFIA